MIAATPRPFRFGVTNSTVGDVRTWTASARRAEVLGYATFLLPDTVRTAAPLPALAAAAAATESLHVGTWVICEPLRGPELLVWETRTMRELYGDRFELGLGAGRPGAEHDAAALSEPFGTPGARIGRLVTTVHLLRERDPGLRILLAASGPRMLALAGRSADSVALGWPPDTDVATAYRSVAAVTAAAQESGNEPELAMGLIAVGDIGAAHLARLGTDAQRLAAHGAVSVVSGTPRQMADQLLRRRDALGVSYVSVPSETVEAFAPVLDLLAGA